MKFKLSLVICLIALQVFTACSQKTKPVEVERPNIVWIVSEDNSKHYLKMFDEHGATAPNIESLAADGLTYTHAFSNAAVCSAARSTLISASYGPRLATHYHRKMEQVPLPEGVEMFPAYLKRAGYHTTNNAKEDYNLFKADNVWDMSSKKATWRDRKEGQPFYHVFNIGTTHESRLHFTREDMKKGTKTDVNSVFVQPNHPQTELFKFTNAYYHDKIQQMDTEVGEVIAKLKEDGLYDSTFIFYYGDHGGVLPGSKGYINEMGVHVPLVVHIPSKYKHLVDETPGTKVDGFVSFIDFGATVLNLAGVELPKGIDGKPFLGKGVSGKEVAKRDETFSYADRFDEKYDMVRAVRKGKFKYTRNFQPFNFNGLMNNYRYKQLAYQEWLELYEAGKLNEIQSQFFEPKHAEELYDVEADPFETNNLADKPEYIETVKELRANLNNRMKSMPDLSVYPEFYLKKVAFSNPVEFGQQHKKDIEAYLEVANLNILKFEDAKVKIDENLKSDDAWKRYWALNTCSSFGKEANEFVSVAKEIAKSDSVLINKVKAAEFLGLVGKQNPVNVMTKALYDTKDGAEAVLMLNSIVLMKDGAHKYKFNIKQDKINKITLEEPLVLRRLEYINKK
ncbi:Sulfatase [Lutibacter oricola]|uniref:Sulfatase n=1 Tax=Lutibacter oricola TaxID=762486 RepID=A0A1H2SGC8_9FLAO|nr:sulfatase [Lutibacter oricola]SDW30763.1 Sulfatase [Lutibacter oricola]